MKSLRILHLVWNGAIGGTENFAFDLAKEQARRHRVILGWMNRAVGRPDCVEGLKLAEFGMRSGYDGWRFLRGLRWVRAFAPDIVHLHDATPLAYWAGWASSAPVTLAHIHTIGNPFSRPTLARRLFMRASAGRVTHYVANSESTRNLLVRLRGLAPARITTIPNALDLSRLDGPRDPAAVRQELGIPAGAPVVGFVGRLHPAKGVDRFLEMAAALRGRRDAYFIVVGDGSERPALEQRARSLGLDSRLRWTGERPDVPRYLAAFDVFVSTSRVETFGIAILEAMAMKVPVVAFAVDAIPELLTGCGRLVPAGDTGACASSVAELLDDPAGRQHLAEAGSRRARGEYGIEHVNRRVEELYIRILEARPGGPIGRESR